VTIQSLDLDTLKRLLFSTRSNQDEFREEFHVVNLPTDFCHLFNEKTKMLETKERASLDADFKQSNCLQRRLINILNVSKHLILTQLC
jgi:hypothetical protein